ncbi:hypothetical protein [Streptomyces fumanus]|uniref:hypothetical protein n=1 Tax=Streptomyces fumanus TaxID=67302 RepID=UPI0034062829
MPRQTVSRRVVTNMSLSFDGHYAKPGNPLDMGWVMPYAVTDIARDHRKSLCEPATTALLGRVDAEGLLPPSPARSQKYVRSWPSGDARSPTVPACAFGR